MKYSLNIFKWISYLFNRVYYCRSRWLHYYVSVPYTKSYLEKQMKLMIDKQNGFFADKSFG